MSSYNTLMNGSDTVPALGDASGDKFLIIGFGHNDEKTEPARYTNPNGDYKTEGSFANSSMSTTSSLLWSAVSSRSSARLLRA